MNRSTQSIILACAGLALLFAVVSAVFDLRLALGAAAIAGSCAVWAALMATVNKEPESPPAPPVIAPATAGVPLVADVAAPPAVPEELTVPGSVEPAAVLSAMLANARSAGEPVSAQLWLEDVGTPTLRLVCSEGMTPTDATPVPVSGSLLGRALADGDSRCEQLTGPDSADGSGVVWRYALPLITDEASGVVVVDFAGAAEPDVEQLDRTSSALRGLLMGSLALHVARSEASSARQLLDTASEMSRLLDPDAVVASALEHALKLSGAETGSVMLVDANGARMRIARAFGLPDDVVGNTRVSEGEGIAGWVLASGRPLVVEDLDHKGPQSRRHGVLSAASVPICDDEGVLGVLNVGSRQFHARFSRSHVRALEAVGRITAIALRNARAMSVTQDLFFDTLKALALALETRDPYSRGGTERVLQIAVALGEAMALSDSDMQSLRLAALLHDIGMSAAGDSVVVTDRALTTVEWGLLKLHPQIAAEVLEQAPSLRAVIPIVFHHHEHYDGGGYSGGLSGESIPVGARILSVADAYVAMTSERPYRGALLATQAMAEIISASGSQFDPRVVEALTDLASIGPGCLTVRECETPSSC